MSRRKKAANARNVILGILVALLTTYALREQLSRPPEERTWHGDVLGVPYDFRVPTLERLRTTYWNEKNPQVFVPQAFGIGWTINFYPLLHFQDLKRVS